MRKVVERCRRVRRAETKLRAKSTDCDPQGGCSAFISIFYSTDDQKQECGGYTREDFTDPAACEKDIQAFRTVEDHTAASFRARTAALDRALRHCAKIDVRPTWGWWLGKDEALHSQIAESKLLDERIRLARDYVADRALQAVALLPAKRKAPSAYWEFIGSVAPELALDLEPRLPPGAAPGPAARLKSAARR